MRLVEELKLSVEKKSTTNAALDNATKEESALLLAEFLRAPALRRLIKPLTDAICTVLQRLLDFKPASQGDAKLTGRLSTAALEGVGELCLVVDLSAYMYKLVPTILNSVLDQVGQ